MTLNLFFITVTIKKRWISLQEALIEQEVERLYEEHKNRQYSLML
ncbi:YrzI family small protein [Bacillaceae bacterium Marseille-Q3522]|nr:YrzI family small protein [Bacillaceae bacterium Marseille-Q3522]